MTQNRYLGANLSIARGWASVDVQVRGKRFRGVDTHPEAYGPPTNPSLFRNIQAVLMAQKIIQTSPLPVVAIGDYNSNAAPIPDLTGAYGTLLASGLTDDLNNIPSRIHQGIDLVLFSQGPIDAVTATGRTVGNAPPTASITEDHAVMVYNTATGQWLWPSDHAGVIVTLDVAKP